MVSPDGGLLAYEHRPDSFHHDSPYYSGPACGGGGEQRDAWWAGSQSLPAEVVVMDLSSGRILWRTEPPTGSHLADFDGRYLVVSVEDQSVIYDIEGEQPPVDVPSRVALMRTPQHLRPEQVFLRAGGLGTAFFGDPVEEAMTTVTGWLGAPSDDELIDPAADDIALPFGYAANRYLRIATWPEFGLTLVFSDGGYFRSDGLPHLISWTLSAPGLTTASGITVGSAVSALETAYGNALRLPDRFHEECGGGWAFRIEPPGSGNEWHRIAGRLDGDPSAAGTVVVGMTGGAQPTC